MTILHKLSNKQCTKRFYDILILFFQKGLIFFGKKEITDEEKKSLQEAYNVVEKFLERSKWIAGNSLTIADFSFVTSITSWSIFEPFDESKHPKMCSWLKEMEKLPYYGEANVPGLNIYREALKKVFKI